MKYSSVALHVIGVLAQQWVASAQKSNFLSASSGIYSIVEDLLHITQPRTGVDVECDDIDDSIGEVVTNPPTFYPEQVPVSNVTTENIDSEAQLSDSPSPTTTTLTPSTPITPKGVCDVAQEIKRIQQEQHVAAASIAPVGSDPYEDYGCFYHDTTENTFISGPLLNQNAPIDTRIQECNDMCDTKHFGITALTCYCYVRTPSTRLTIGSCAYIGETCLESDYLMDMYMKRVTSVQCDQDNSKAVRNFLVQEHNAPKGFDAISNSFKYSPLDLEMGDGCASNMYEIYTDVSEGSNTLITESSTLKKYTEEKRTHISGSLKIDVTMNENVGFFFRGKESLAGSLDIKLKSLEKKSGSSSDGSKVVSSFGVKRLARIDLVNFDHRHNFVTFNSQFANMLRKYHDGGFKIEHAKDIFDKYGMFVVEKGMYGGYRQLQAMTSFTDSWEEFKSENDFNLCFQAAIHLKAREFFGLATQTFDGQIEGCTEIVKQEMREEEEKFSEDNTQEAAQGGTIVGHGDEKHLEVTPQNSILLTNPDHYPAGDNGIKLRVITDFLRKDKVSPLTVKRHLLTEIQYDAIRVKLEQHMEQVLNEMKGKLDQCGSCEGNVYLEEVGGYYGCVCFENSPPFPNRPLIPLIPDEDKTKKNQFGGSCSMTENLAVIAAGTADNGRGAVYLYHLDGKYKKLTPTDTTVSRFGWSLSMDKVIAVTSLSKYVEIFSLHGDSITTISEPHFDGFGGSVVTHGDKVAMRADFQGKKYIHIYSIEGIFLNSLEISSNGAMAMSDKYLVFVPYGNNANPQDHTLVYENSGSYNLFTEFPREGYSVAISGDRVAIGNRDSKTVHLYDLNGSGNYPILRKTFQGGVKYGWSVDLTENHIVVGAPGENGNQKGAAYIYNKDGGQLEKNTGYGLVDYDNFGVSVCANDRNYIIGKPREYTFGQNKPGEAFLYTYPPNSHGSNDDD